MMIWCKPYTTIISLYNSSWFRAVNIKFPWWWTYVFCIVYTCWQIIKFIPIMFIVMSHFPIRVTGERLCN